MKKLSSKLWALPMAAVLVAPDLAGASESSAITLTLQNTGVDPDATGRVVSSLKSSSSVFGVIVSKLDANKSYAVQIGGVVEGEFVTDKKGNGKLSFKTKSNSNPLDFDPRGQTLQIHDGVATVLQAVISGTGEPSGIVVNERVLLAPTNSSDAIKGKAEYRARKDGEREFKVQVERITGGDFELYVNGVKRGDLRLSGREAKIEFSTEPKKNELLLDFDPRGQVIDVMQAGAIRATGTLLAKAQNVSVATPSIQNFSIPSTGADDNGTAKAKLRIRENARKDFSVEIEDVPVGAYELLIGGNVVGTINVAATTSGTEGEIEFNAGDDHPDGELPLTFDPAGASIVIRKDGTVYFEGVLGSNSSTGGSNNGGGSVTFPPEAPTKFEENLAKTGVISGASGDAKFEIRDNSRRKFSVEIEDVPAGAYKLYIGGELRRTINAVAVVGGVEGEIEFSHGDDNPKGELPMNFEPRGQLIEIKNAAGEVIFSHLFGNGSAPGGSGGGSDDNGGSGNVAQPTELKLPLISTGADSNASAEAKFRRKDNGDQDFEVEVEDVNVGSYELVVGGVVRATINVVTVPGGTRGKVEFDSDSPKAGELLLDFAVAGQEVIVRKDGTVYFSRVIPAN